MSTHPGENQRKQQNNHNKTTESLNFVEKTFWMPQSKSVATRIARSYLDDPVNQRHGHVARGSRLGIQEAGAKGLAQPACRESWGNQMIVRKLLAEWNPK